MLFQHYSSWKNGNDRITILKAVAERAHAHDPAAGAACKLVRAPVAACVQHWFHVLAERVMYRSLAG